VEHLLEDFVNKIYQKSRNISQSALGDQRDAASELIASSDYARGIAYYL